MRKKSEVNERYSRKRDPKVKGEQKMRVAGKRKCT